MQDGANTELIRQAYQRIQQGDLEAFLQLIHDDIAWQIPDMPNVPFAGTRRGRQQVAEFFRIMAEAQEVIEFTPEEFIAQGD